MTAAAVPTGVRSGIEQVLSFMDQAFEANREHTLLASLQDDLCHQTRAPRARADSWSYEQN